jgi:3-oxoacyl-[acyl-carrier protein] reductase
VQRLFDETKKSLRHDRRAGELPLEDITEDEFHREFNINVLGTILATKGGQALRAEWRAASST